MNAGAHFSSYAEATDWLYGTQLFGIKLGLDNVVQLMNGLALPDLRAQVIHVAGTNGKGSVCAFADSLLRANDFRVGLFTSPHIVSFRERMRISGTCIPEAEVATRLSRLREIVTGWDPHPTFFELTLALALDWFRDSATEVNVLETGMGGRLDATNAVSASVSVITPIAIDHQKWLGNSLERIAVEKAGILKPGVPAVSASQPPEVEAVVQTTAAAVGAPLTFIREDHVAEISRVSIGLDGPHQRNNAALALAAVRAIGVEPDSESVRSAFGSVRWRARFERFLNDRVIVDGAHNLHAARALVATWKSVFGSEKANILFGTVKDKDHQAILGVLASIAAAICYVPVASPRAVDPETLAEHSLPAPDVPQSVASSLSDAIASAVDGGDGRVLVTGSLFLAGEAIAVLEGEGFEQSAQ